MSHRIERGPGFLRIIFEGVVTDRDFEELARAGDDIERASIRAGLSIPNRLTNLQGVTGLSFSGDAVWRFVREGRERRYPNAFKSAVVADGPAQLGLLEVFQSYNDNPQIVMAVFRDEPSARAWLAAPAMSPPKVPVAD